jgi:hypothetical protein
MGQRDRLGQLTLPAPQTAAPAVTRSFVPEVSPPPLITQGAGTR